MRARVYLDNPESTLEAARMLLAYFGDDTEKTTVYPKALKRASRLLKLMARAGDDGSVTWVRSKEWRSRLKLAGLDPDTLDVVDQYRWNLAWEQLSRTRTFRDDIQQRNIAMGYEAPPADAFISARTLEPKKKQSPTVKTTISDYLSSDLKQRLRGGKSKK